MKKLLIGSGIFVFLALIAIGTMYAQGNEIVESGEIMYMVSHSEYWSGEEGQIIARLYDWRGDPITVDNCTTDILYPDKSLFVDDGLTDDSLQATTGTHFYNFTTPAIEGVYQYIVTCSYDSKTRSVANSFHLSPALNFQVNINNSITALTAQELAHYIVVTNNLTTIRNELGIVDSNVDLALLGIEQINGTVNTIEGNTDTIINTVNEVNTTVNGLQVTILEINATVNGIDTLVTTIDGKIDTIDSNVDQLLLDVADVQTDTTYIRANMMTQDNISIITDGQANILSNITAVQNFCDSAETSGSSLCLWVDEIKSKVTNAFFIIALNK